MNNNQMKVTAIVFMFLGIVSCSSSTQKKVEDVNEANADLVEATSDLREAIIDSTEDYKNYMRNAKAKLAENDKLIAELKAKRIDNKKTNLAEYKKELAKLEAKNADLALRIEEPKENAHDKWENFKTDFNKEMDDLGKAISNRAEKNMNQ